MLFSSKVSDTSSEWPSKVPETPAMRLPGQAEQRLVQGVEATLFATLMSILNGGGFAGSFLGGTLTSWFGVTSDKFDNLAALVVVCTLSSLAPLPLLRMVPEGSPREAQTHRDSS